MDHRFTIRLTFLRQGGQRENRRVVGRSAKKRLSIEIRELRQLVAEGAAHSIVVSPYPRPGGSYGWVIQVNGSVVRSVRGNTRLFSTIDNARKMLEKLKVRQFLVRLTLPDLDEETSL